MTPEDRMAQCIKLLLGLAEEVSRIQQSDEPAAAKEAKINACTAVQQNLVDEYKALERQGFSMPVPIESLMPDAEPLLRKAACDYRPLEQRFWYRLCKVAFVVAYALAALTLAALSYSEYHPRRLVDSTKTLIVCSNGTKYPASQNGIIV